MKKRFKKAVWRTYETEYKLLNKNRRPDPMISLCKISLNMLGLGIALIIIGFIALIVGILSLPVALIGWFTGFSPQPFRWFFSGIENEEKNTFWKFKEVEAGYFFDRPIIHRKYYRINGNIAPWQIVLFPLALLVLILQQPVALISLKWASSPVWFPISRIFVKARGMQCPMPLDFNDVASTA